MIMYFAIAPAIARKVTHIGGVMEIRKRRSLIDMRTGQYQIDDFLGRG